MQLKMISSVAILAVLSICVAAQKLSQVQPNAGFDSLKTLTGEWSGTVNEGGETLQTTAVVAVVSDNSAIMHQLDPGSPHNMITMFHTDGAELLATHYCSAHNQPRMKLVPSSDSNSLLFDFKDGTNIAPGDGHMQSVKFIFVDANHHYEDWSYIDGGKIYTRRFDFHRKKA
jgi:hypothetical protein